MIKHPILSIQPRQGRPLDARRSHMRDVEGRWLLRYMHANGASMFLIVVHLHIFRGLYYASYSSLLHVYGVLQNPNTSEIDIEVGICRTNHTPS
jgi:hypothetical protein